MQGVSVFRTLSVCVSATVLASGCLTPPCTCAQQGAAAPVATQVAPAAASGATATAAPAPGEKAVIWDGDENGASIKGGWQDCDKKPGCKATLGPEAGVGFNNSVGLKFHGEGPGWIGFGWNWFGWYPTTAGTDISGYKTLAFHIRIEAKNADEAPDPGSLGVAIKCSSNPEKGVSNTISLTKNTKENLIDGQWHEVELRTSDLKKAEFDPKTAWELDFTTWSPVPRNFNIYFDDIRFQN